MITIDNERCIQCEDCVNECHWSALKMEDEKVIWDSEKCSYCGHCMALCPRDCIIIDGDGYNCEDVEDLAFSKRTGPIEMRNLILGRRAVRYFTDTKVTDEQLSRILDAGRYAPTGMNRQSNAFMVVDSVEKRKELTKDTMAAIERLVDAGKLPPQLSNLYGLYKEKGIDNAFYDAPMVIYVFADDDVTGDVNGAIAATMMGMQVNAERLGYCFIKMPTMAFMDAEFANKWQLPEGKKCVIALAVGESEPEYFSSVPRLEASVTRL